MADPFHLPDLPNSGYATHREKELSDAIMQFMRECERDRVRLLTIVIEGRERWRKVAQSVWRGLRIGEDPTLLDEIFYYFELQAVRPGVQRMLLDARQNPAKWRHVMDCAMPHLEKELHTLKLAQQFGYN